MQLRGDRLKKYLSNKLDELVLIYANRSENYVYSQQEFAKFSSVSRETVRKYQVDIDAQLAAASISKRNLDKDARVNNLQGRVIKIQRDLAKAQAMYEAMRIQYVSMIESLLANSIEVHALIPPSVDRSSCEKLYGQCILCGMNLLPSELITPNHSTHSGSD